MVSTSSIVCMLVSAVISIGLPVALFLAFRKRFGFKVVPMLVGAAAFIVFALVLEQLMHTLVLRPGPDGSIALRSNPLLYMLYGAFAAGIFEETGRFVSFKLLKKKYTGVGTGLSYGIGHGGIEAILLAGVTMIGNLAISTALNSGASVPLSAAQLAALTQTPAYMFLVGGVERIFAVVIQISLSVIVWHAVNTKAKTWLYPVAILIHAAIDAPAALYQSGAIQSLFLVEGIVAVCATAVAMFAIFTNRKLIKNIIK